MPRAMGVANWLVQYRADEMAAPVDPMSLEKLVYYAQAFHLALFNRPIFDDEIRAWRHGPVVRSVYGRYNGALPIERPVGEVASLDQDTEAFLREVVSFFGGLTALTLSDATHQENPWKNAREGFSHDQNSDVHIPNAHLREYYSRLIEEGELALSRQELLSVLEEPRWGALYVAGISARRMARHPLYRPILAKKLSEPVDDGEDAGTDRA
jgi:uncharacterized phage-associated protein